MLAQVRVGWQEWGAVRKRVQGERRKKGIVRSEVFNPEIRRNAESDH